MVGPPRSKYCSATRRCVPVFDHYCTFLRNVVGQDNYAFFGGTVISATVACGCLSSIGASLLRAGHSTIANFCVTVWFGMFALAGSLLCSLHLFLACRGLTMNELIQISEGRMPAYLIDAKDGTYSNPYNNGCFSNLRSRLFPKPPASTEWESPDGHV